ncbi:hypothetical protein PHLCEN_2v3226 [Hermanssonia centrifuga]|uniref:F-box domain-containing protein n=1 Tax=Hermanssonia centrifuga TaxID=98765 RepID=A0A2R6QXM0_9APHY|nr:hypothetical protein PHLCEN_2v3226 [Hermanssonia centrifuga]
MFPPSEYERYCSNFASTPTTSGLDQIGARIPQEVLRRILLFIQGGYHFAQKQKDDVGQLALTCRYWASQCQPAIFKSIRLRSGKDLEGLLSLMASPLSRVAGYIKTLWLVQEGRWNVPWLHLVALRLVPKLSLDTEETIYLSIDRSYEPAAIRSIHDGLPRSYPSFSSHISLLYLSDARFNSFADLLHLVDEMPSLQHLYCVRVTWPMAPDTPPVVSHQRRIPPDLSDVTMGKCTDNSALVRILTGRRRKARASTTASLDFGLDSEQQHTIYKLVHKFAKEEVEMCRCFLTTIDSAYSE